MTDKDMTATSQRMTELVDLFGRACEKYGFPKNFVHEQARAALLEAIAELEAQLAEALSEIKAFDAMLGEPCRHGLYPKCSYYCLLCLPENKHLADIVDAAIAESKEQ